MFFWISRWVSIENYNQIFLQEVALVFQENINAGPLPNVPERSSRLTANQPPLHGPTDEYLRCVAQCASSVPLLTSLGGNLMLAQFPGLPY